MLIVVGLVLAQDPLQVGLAPYEGAARSSRRHPPIQRSAMAFIRGVWMLRSTLRIPASARMASNAVVKLDPLSRIMNLTRSVWSPMSMIRLWACWVVHSPIGCKVTPRMRMRLVVCSIAART